MNERALNIETEIASLERKADQQCTGHAWLRDKYRRRAACLDYGLMLAATYMLGLSLVEPALGWSLSLGMDRAALVVVLSLLIFFFSVVQFKSGWKRTAEAHQRAFKEFATVKSECRTLTSGVRNVTSTEHQRIRAHYDMITEVGTHIPDNEFLKCKAHHVRKVFVSRYLDDHPGARPIVVHFKLFLRDNLNINLLT